MERGMTDDEALKEYATALLRFLTYFDGPERAKDPDWWGRVIQKEDEAWWELHRRDLLHTDKYSALVLDAHRLANKLRVARERRQ
jgi:hypothetical protein